ncbi:hypothetical protein SteCoe_18595 [Stentor coeruleus]|uniref:Uncharacterized protein n=1 Tax=Stentor coeruleus TaxID=5963 RepID=A0A1R2BW32_9CILI|nr:hypothetical protein SteCoe_18595 [Stentor coeruleus]
MRIIVIFNMASECFNFANKIDKVDNLMNGGSVMCLILACLMSVMIVYGIYADGKKPKANLKKLPRNQDNIN